MKDPDFKTTDDCSVVKKYLPQEEIKIVKGEACNMKFTYKEDIIILEQLLKTKENATSNSSYFTVYRGITRLWSGLERLLPGRNRWWSNSRPASFLAAYQHIWKITNDTYLWGTVGVGTPFSKSDTRAFDYSFGFEGTGALGRKEHRIFIDQLYGRVRWQNLILDLGIIKPEIVYDGLSSTNGDMLYSTNSREYARY